MVDTLACDSAQIAALQQNPAYDYNRELVAQQQTLWDWLWQQVVDWLNSVLGKTVASGVADAVLVFIGIVVLGLLVWLLYRYRPELFMRKAKDAVEEEEGVETIYGIDFDAEISQALSAGNYRQAVRYVYLKKLRQLSDTGRVDWQPSKTPSQYVYEVKSEGFRLLTQHFLRVRYGNFEATRELYDEVVRLAQEGGGA